MEKENNSRKRYKDFYWEARLKERKKEKYERKDTKNKIKIEKEKLNMIENLTKEMNLAAKELDFERAMQLRDIIFEMEAE